MRGRIARLRPAGRCVFVLLVFTLLAAGRADAQWNGFIHINGGEQNVDRIVTNTLQVEIYDETATYEAAMRDAGFSDFHWVDAMLDPTEQDDPFWDDFMAQAPLTAFCATRA